MSRLLNLVIILSFKLQINASWGVIYGGLTDFKDAAWAGVKDKTKKSENEDNVETSRGRDVTFVAHFTSHAQGFGLEASLELKL